MSSGRAVDEFVSRASDLVVTLDEKEKNEHAEYGYLVVWKREKISTYV
jgi:hypothetical protein